MGIGSRSTMEAIVTALIGGPHSETAIAISARLDHLPNEVLCAILRRMRIDGVVFKDGNVWGLTNPVCYLPPPGIAVQVIPQSTPAERRAKRAKLMSERTEKKCGRCRQSKPLDAFYATKKRIDGRQGYCIVCMLEYQRDRERAEADALIGEKHCPKCRTSKPIAEFHRKRGAIDGRQGYCRDCNSNSQKRVRIL